MNFIEDLKQLGGVKPCPNYYGMDKKCPGSTCPACHGTGQILDLAPLLANPKELRECVRSLFYNNKELSEAIGYPAPKSEADYEEREHDISDGFVVIGPQRAHSLVYEIARQLGGTSVIWASGVGYDGEPVGGSLSLPIPPDATVLFVTDRYDKDELWNVFHAGESNRTVLPYILCLISNEATHQPYGWPVISLHQEKP